MKKTFTEHSIVQAVKNHSKFSQLGVPKEQMIISPMYIKWFALCIQLSEIDKDQVIEIMRSGVIPMEISDIYVDIINSEL